MTQLLHLVTNFFQIYSGLIHYHSYIYIHISRIVTMNNNTRTLAHKIYAIQGNEGFLDPVNNIHSRTLKDMFLIFFLKRFPDRTTEPQTGLFTIDYSIDRLIRNFMWHERKHIFEEGSLVKSLLVAMCLRDTRQGAIQPAELIQQAPLILERLIQSNFLLDASELNDVTLPLYRNFLKCLDFILDNVHFHDHLLCRTDVAKMQYAYMFNNHVYNVEQGFVGSLNEIKLRIVQHIKRKAEIIIENERNVRAARSIMHHIPEDTYRYFIHSHTLSVENQIPEISVQDALGIYVDPDREQVYTVLNTMVFG